MFAYKSKKLFRFDKKAKSFVFDFFPLSVKGFQSKLPFSRVRWKLGKLYLGTFCHGGVLLVVVIVVVVVYVVVVYVVVAYVVVVVAADKRQDENLFLAWFFDNSFLNMSH